MDRDKEKAIKLGTLLRGSIPLTSIKVLEGLLPTEEEMSGGGGSSGRKKKSKSELECEVISKKKAAGDLVVDIRLKPSESMSAAGTMLIELFRVVEGLIESPLRCRWTAGMYFIWLLFVCLVVCCLLLFGWLVCCLFSKSCSNSLFLFLFFLCFL